MAQPTNLHSDYDQVGIREDLSDLIGMVDPTETPAQSMILNEANTAKNTTHDWQTQALATANRDNAAITGDDTTLDAVTATVRINNRTQIFKRSFGVSGTAGAVETAGREEESDWQKLLKGRELKRDIEAMILCNNALVVGNDTTARKSRGLGRFIAGTNADGTHGTGGSTAAIVAVDTATTVTAGTNRAISLALINSASQRAFANGGNPKYLVAPPTVKQSIGALMGSSGSVVPRYDSASKKAMTAIITGVDVFTSDFGTVAIVADRFCVGGVTGDAKAAVFFIDPEYARVSYLRKIGSEKLAKTGDSERWQVLGELCLEVLAPLAHAKVDDVTP